MPGEDQYLCNEQWHKVSELFAISSQLLMFKEFHSPSIYRYWVMNGKTNRFLKG